MKSSAHTPSATSLPRAPRDEASARSVRYLITMGIRIVCFALMVLVTPYGWYTWIFAAGAIVLPYFAVIVANVGSDVRDTTAENPELALPAPSAEPPRQAPSDDAPPVIQIHESPPRPPRGSDA